MNMLLSRTEKMSNSSKEKYILIYQIHEFYTLSECFLTVKWIPNSTVNIPT